MDSSKFSPILAEFRPNSTVFNSFYSVAREPNLSTLGSKDGGVTWSPGFPDESRQPRGFEMTAATSDADPVPLRPEKWAKSMKLILPPYP